MTAAAHTTRTPMGSRKSARGGPGGEILGASRGSVAGGVDGLGASGENGCTTLRRGSVRVWEAGDTGARGSAGASLGAFARRGESGAAFGEATGAGWGVEFGVSGSLRHEERAPAGAGEAWEVEAQSVGDR